MPLLGNAFLMVKSLMVEGYLFFYYIYVYALMVEGF